MAAKSSTPTFILELPVKTDDSQARILQKRFEAAQQIYNACLGESMRRLNLIRQSKNKVYTHHGNSILKLNFIERTHIKKQLFAIIH